MAEPYVGEIRIFPFAFAPLGWAFCNGQFLPISQNTALFSLLGTFFGGNGTSNFALPNLQGSVPLGTGQGPGLSPRDLGQAGGAPAVTLTTQTVAAHTHGMLASPRDAELNAPGPQNALARSNPATIYTAPSGATLQALSQQTLGTVGNGQPHNNLMPYLTLNFCIALQGVYPARS